MDSNDWKRLFPDEDFRFRMGVHPGDSNAFFATGVDAGSVLSARQMALDESPNQYAGAVAGSQEAICEAAALMRGAASVSELASELDQCLKIGRKVTADWVLLSPNVEAGHPVIAGVVCFPSGWSLPEKLGQPLQAVHRPAASLNEDLGDSMDRFLRRLAPGAAWERDNWGLSADEDLNHHPSRRRVALDESATLGATWLRLERQLLTRLPESRAILFGIRVTHHRLDLLAEDGDLAGRIARALETMPGPIASYKGLDQSRATLAQQLRAKAR